MEVSKLLTRPSHNVHRTCTIKSEHDSIPKHFNPKLKTKFRTLTLDSQRLNLVIVNTTRIQVLPENRNEFMQTVCPLLEPIRREKGCMSYRIFVDATDQNASLLVGEWQTQNDYTNHLHSKGYGILMGAITVLGVPNCVECRLLYAVPVLATVPESDG